MNQAQANKSANALITSGVTRTQKPAAPMNQPAMGGIDPMALMGRLGEEAKKEENDGDNN